MTTTRPSRLVVTLPSERQIMLTREFDAPRELVFKAFSSAEHLRHWWGQAGSTLTACELDFRPGGAWRFVERDAAGSEWGFRGEIREIVPPERIVQTFEFDGMPGHVSVETMVLEDLGGRTRLQVTSMFESTEDRDGMLQSGMEKGAGETYDKLESYLHTLANEADREIVLSRTFDAPRDLVFRAWTDPHHVAEWFGPNGFTLTVQEMNVRPGGVFRYIMHAPDGTNFPNVSVFREVVEPERLVYTQGSGQPGDPGFEVTVTFAPDDHGNKTRLTLRQLHATAEARDYVVREYHAVDMGYQTLDRFAAYLQTTLR